MPLPLLKGWHDYVGAALMQRFLAAPGMRIDFSAPEGEPALAAPDSLTWRIFKNPIALFAGGIGAVLLELAEPRVRTGVWENTSFRTDPMTRMKRTGMAAMATAYAARSVSTRLIANVGRMHERIRGATPEGAAFSALDPDLLDWVQTTASFGFLEAYCAYAAPLSDPERDAFYAEAEPAAKLYGVEAPARTQAEAKQRFSDMLPRLAASPIVFDFLRIVSRAPILPPALKPVQGLMIRAGVDLVPDPVLAHLGVGERWRLRSWEKRLVRLAGAACERIAIPSSPPVEACRRIGLPGDWLHASRSRRLRTI